MVESLGPAGVGRLGVGSLGRLGPCAVCRGLTVGSAHVVAAPPTGSVVVSGDRPAHLATCPSVDCSRSLGREAVSSWSWLVAQQQQ